MVEVKESARVVEETARVVDGNLARAVAAWATAAKLESTETAESKAVAERAVATW